MLTHQTHFQLAVELTASTRHQEALAEFTKALQLQPRHFPSLLNRGTIYSLLRLWPLAIQDFNQAIKLEPSDPMGYYNRFVARAGLLKYSLALHDMYCALSCLYVQKAVSSQSLKHFTKAISLVENNQFAYIERGEYYRENGKDALALNEYCCALEIEPNNQRALALRALIYRQLGEVEKSQRDHQAAVALSQVSTEPMVLHASIKDISTADTVVEIQSRLQQLRELRDQVSEKVDRFAKSKSVSFLKDGDSTEKYASRKQSQSKEGEQSLSSKFAKILESNVNRPDQASGDTNSERRLFNIRSTGLISPPAEKTLSHHSSRNEDSKDEGSERAVIDHKSSKGSKKASEIRKLADLIMDDEEFGNHSLLSQPSTPLSNFYESKSMTSRTPGTSSQIIKPTGKKQVEVQLVAATLTHNTQMFGNMSPYCTVIYENEVKNTKVASKAGKNPVWNETFTFQIRDSNLVKLQVWDKETLKKDDFVGAGTITIAEPSTKCQLVHQGKPAGTVYLKLRLV